MTDQPVIRLQGVSKKYHLYESHKLRLYEALHPFKKTFHREYWALRDIDFEILAGETVGILGVNGSGKSTLLQIICSILQPTAGTVEVRGKVAALIELGAGFNPDLTGRENAEVNCALMGLDRTEVRNTMPEIEAFAKIDEFFDQPVKTYSSGMFMRVAFATAISVDPDILVIDEALAVGDARFQEKCFSKFREFQQQGKTIILVTHDRFAVPRLCSVGMLLDKGRLVRVGKTNEIVNLYAEILASGEIRTVDESGSGPALNHTGDLPDSANTPAARDATTPSDEFGMQPSVEQAAIQDFLSDRSAEDRVATNRTYNENEHRIGDQRAQIVDYLIFGDGQLNPDSVASGACVDIYIKVHFSRKINDFIYGLTITTADGIVLFGTNTANEPVHMEPGNPDELRVYRIRVDLTLGKQDIFITLGVSDGRHGICDSRQSCVHLVVTDPIAFIGVAKLSVAFKEISDTWSV